MQILIILALIAFFIYISPQIKRFFEKDPLTRILLIISWGISSVLGVFSCSMLRVLYLVPAEESDSLFRSGGEIDEAYIWISLSVLILFFVMAFSFYKKKLWERFTFITSLQLILITGLHIIQVYFNKVTDSKNIYLWITGFIIGIILLIYNRSKSKAKFYSEIKELITGAFK